MRRRFAGRRRRRGDGRRQLRAFRDVEKVERDAELRAIARRESIEIHNAKVKATKARRRVWDKASKRKPPIPTPSAPETPSTGP